MIRDTLLSWTAQRWITSHTYTLTRLLAFLDEWTKGEFITPCSRKREWEEERDRKKAYHHLLLGQPAPHSFSSSPFPCVSPSALCDRFSSQVRCQGTGPVLCCGVIGWFVNVNDLPLKRINQPCKNAPTEAERQAYPLSVSLRRDRLFVFLRPGPQTFWGERYLSLPPAWGSFLMSSLCHSFLVTASFPSLFRLRTFSLLKLVFVMADLK